MIGKVTFPGGKEIILNDQGEIESNDPVVQKMFATDLRLYRMTDPTTADGLFGECYLTQVADEFNGKLELEEKEKPKGYVVY